MAYNRTQWVDNTAPFIDAANLNNIEDGISSSVAVIPQVTSNTNAIAGLSSGEHYQGLFTPASGAEYPQNPQKGYSWYIDGLTAPYPFTGGDLNGKHGDNGDKMLWNGTAWSLIAKAAIPTDVVLRVDTISNLSTVDKTKYPTVIVEDSLQGGTFVYDASRSTEHDDGTVFNGWVRQYNGAVEVTWFGAKNTGDKTFDNSVAFTKAIKHVQSKTSRGGGKVNIKEGVYYFTNTIEVAGEFVQAGDIAGNGVYLVGNGAELRGDVTPNVISGTKLFHCLTYFITFENISFFGFDLAIEIYRSYTSYRSSMVNIDRCYFDFNQTSIRSANRDSVFNITNCGFFGYKVVNHTILDHHAADTLIFEKNWVYIEKIDSTTHCPIKINSLQNSTPGQTEKTERRLIIKDNLFTPPYRTPGVELSNAWIEAKYSYMLDIKDNRFGGESHNNLQGSMTLVNVMDTPDSHEWFTSIIIKDNMLARPVVDISTPGSEISAVRFIGGFPKVVEVTGNIVNPINSGFALPRNVLIGTGTGKKASDFLSTIEQASDTTTGRVFPIITVQSDSNYLPASKEFMDTMKQSMRIVGFNGKQSVLRNIDSTSILANDHNYTKGITLSGNNTRIELDVFKLFDNDSKEGEILDVTMFGYKKSRTLGKETGILALRLFSYIRKSPSSVVSAKLKSLVLVNEFGNDDALNAIGYNVEWKDSVQTDKSYHDYVAAGSTQQTIVITLTDCVITGWRAKGLMEGSSSV